MRHGRYRGLSARVRHRHAGRFKRRLPHVFQQRRPHDRRDPGRHAHPHTHLQQGSAPEEFPRVQNPLRVPRRTRKGRDLLLSPAAAQYAGETNRRRGGAGALAQAGRNDGAAGTFHPAAGKIRPDHRFGYVPLGIRMPLAEGMDRRRAHAAADLRECIAYRSVFDRRAVVF